MSNPPRTALEQAAYVPDVKPDFREQFVQGAAATAPRGTDLDALEQQMAQHHQQRLDEARMHKQNVAQSGALLHYGIDPSTGKPLTPEQRQRYMNEYNAAKQAYMKVAGVNKQTKDAINKSFMIMDHMIGPGAQNQQGPPQPGGFTPNAQAQQAAPGASPQDQAIAAEGAGATAAPQGQPAAPGGGGPPPVPFEDEAPFLMAELQEQLRRRSALADMKADVDFRRQQADELVKSGILKPDSRDYHEYVLTGKMPTGSASSAGLGSAKQRDVLGSALPEGTETVTGEPVDPEVTYDVFERKDDGKLVALPSGVGKPKRIQYSKIDPNTGQPDGPYLGFQRGNKYYDASMNELDTPNLKGFSAWMMPRTTITQGYRSEPQQDGSIKLVPVTTSSTQYRGQVPGSKPSTNANTTVPSPPPVVKQGSGVKGSTKPSGTGGVGGRVVGGKVPPGVAKAYEEYNASQERLKVMQDALPKALKGDQQAMINLLYNHIGMTTGLQKGGRITQEVINEAQTSAPWEATILARIGLDKEFEITPDLLRGVVLTSENMHNMIGLAEDRTEQDRLKWQREIQGAKSGYGMMGTPPPSPSGGGGTSADPNDPLGIRPKKQ